mgnify:CR=1 FL=1
MNLNIDKVGESILDIANDYVDKTTVELEATLEETADKILDYIRTNAPRSGKSNALADSFIKESYSSGLDKRIVIYSKTKGSLVHLIEFGFTHVGGKKIKGRPFMRPAYDKFAPEMIEKMKQIMEGKS